MRVDFFSNQYSEKELEEILEYYNKHKDIFLRYSIYFYMSGTQRLSEEFMIKNIEYISIESLIPNEKIPEDVKQRIINLKKVIDQ